MMEVFFAEAALEQSPNSVWAIIIVIGSAIVIGCHTLLKEASRAASEVDGRCSSCNARLNRRYPAHCPKCGAPNFS